MQRRMSVPTKGIPERKEKHNRDVKQRCEIALGKFENSTSPNISSSLHFHLSDLEAYIKESADSVAFRNIVDASKSSKW